MGQSHLLHLHPDTVGSAVDVVVPARTGICRWTACVVEPVRDVYYDLVLNFDKNTFVYVFRRVEYELGDGIYETSYSGSFVREASKNPQKTTKKKVSSAGLSPRRGTLGGGPGSPTARQETVYYVCRVELRTQRFVWEPWDPRLPTENVLRVNEPFHQEMLFREDGEVRGGEGGGARSILIATIFFFFFRI